MANTNTTHSDRVAGWSIIGLFVSGLASMILASFAPHLSPSAQTALLNVGLTCVGMVGGSLMPRGNTPTPPPADTQAVTVQVPTTM